MEKLKNKNIIFLFINILVIFITYFIVFSYQKYSFLYQHENFLYYEGFFDEFNPLVRIPATILYYLTNIVLPDVLSINNQDYKTTIGAFIVSFIFIMICFTFTKLFFVNKKENLPIIKNKIFSIVYLLSFLFLSIAIFYIFDFLNLTDYFLQIDEVVHFYEYYVVYIFIIPFYIFIYRTIVKNEEIKNPYMVLYYSLCGFLSGFWQELTSLTTFFTIFIILIYLVFKKRDLLKQFGVICVFLFSVIGCIGAYSTGNHLSIDYDLFSLIPFCLSKFSLFIKTYINYMFINKVAFWFVIAIVFTYLLKKDFGINKNERNRLFVVCFAILGSYLLACIGEMFAYNILMNNEYVFERNFDNIYQCHLFEIVIIFLVSYIYHNSGKLAKKIILSIISTVILVLSIYLHIRYEQLITEKINTRLLSYRIEKACAIYSMLGETILLPAKNLNVGHIQNSILFTLTREYGLDDRKDYAEVMKNRYFDESYARYRYYFNHQYRNKLIGFMYVDNDVANSELDKRLELFDDKQENEQELIKNGIKFEPIKRKYGNKVLTLEDIDNIEKQKGKSDILLKARAYINYKNKDYDTALKLYKAYLINNPNDFDALINLAKLYEIKKDYNNAKLMYKTLIQLDDKNIWFKNNYLKILYNIDKNYKEALVVCDDIIATGVKMAAVYINRGLILYFLNRDIKEVEEQFGKAIQIDEGSYLRFLADNNNKNSIREFKLSELEF